MKKVTFLIAALSFTLFSNAQQAKTGKQPKQEKNDNSLLWKIEGNGLTQPSYVYGTIHMLCAPDFEIKEKVSTAFNNTSNLVMELDMDDPKELQEMQNMMKSTTTLSSLLTDEEEKKADVILKSAVGMSLKQADNISPLGLMSLSIMSSYACPPAEMKMYEVEFLTKAIAQNKKIGGLETIADQMAAVGNSFTIQEILKQMELKREYSSVLAEMTKAYKEQNLPKLYETVTDKRFMDENAKKAMLTVRNEKWIAKMPAIMKQESTFFAVGAGHLYGNDGVITLLRNKGFKVTPVQ